MSTTNEDDRVQRALAAGDFVTVGGVQYMLRPVVVQHLCDLEREALRYYQEQYLSAFRLGLATMEANGRMEELMLAETRKVAEWDLDSIPRKAAHDCSDVPATDAAKTWVREQFGMTPDEALSDRLVRAVLVDALDSGELTAAAVKRMCGAQPRRGRVRYDMWWMTGTTAGKLSGIHSSVRHAHPEIKRSDIAGWPPAKITEAIRIVERLTAANMGNM